MKKLTIYEAGYAILKLPALLDYDEPITALDDRAIRILESCLEQPFTTFNQKYAYRYISHKAAVMFYLIIKNHPLENGNKRSAVAVTLTFLFKNKRWLDMTPDSLYQTACEVAASPASDSDLEISKLNKLFKTKMVTVKD